MKRTVAGVVMLAGVGGGCAGTRSGGVADGAMPFGQVSSTPAGVTAAGQIPTEMPTKTAVYKGDPGSMSGVSQTAGFSRVLSRKAAADCGDGSCAPARGHFGHHSDMGYGAGNGLPASGPVTSGLANWAGHGAGILPVPAMGPWGAVAAVGANGTGSGMYNGMYANGRTSIRFTNPAGMKIGWQTAPGAYSDSGLEAPARYNFAQANTYRLRLSGIPNRPGKQFYPTLEVYPATLQTVTYLSHATVPVTFTDEDFERAAAGSLVVKVVYLPSERFQDLAAVAGAEEIVSTLLEPGVNPVAEANRRGTILAVITLGNIDLQDPNTPAPDAPVMGGPVGAVPVPPVGVAPKPMTAPATLPPVTAPGAARVPAVGRPVSVTR